MELNSLRLSYGLPDLHQLIGAQGWTVKKISYDKKTNRFVAVGQASHGQQLEGVGPTDQKAMAMLLHNVMHLNNMRSSKLSMWTHMFTDQLGAIAEAYAKAPVYEMKSALAFMTLGKESQARLDTLTEHLEILKTNNPEPYASPDKMHDDVKKRRRLEVSTANLEHPVWSDDQSFAFRVCHDVLGYVAAGAGWDWQGENQAFAAHAAVISEDAQKALFTESIAQSAYATYYQAYGPRKVCLFPQFLDEAQDKENPGKGHRGIHPSLTLPPLEEPEVKSKLGHSTSSFIFNNSAPHTAAVDPSLQDPNHAVGVGEPMSPNARFDYGDPLDAEAVKQNASLIDTEWTKLNKEDPGELATMKQAIVNAFRVVLLSPRKDLRWNAIHYQDIADIPGDESDPTAYWHKLENSRQAWNVERFGEEHRFDHTPYAKQWRKLEQLVYQRDPQAGFEAAKKEAGDFLFRQLTRIQDEVMKQDADRPEDKQRDMYQIENESNKLVAQWLDSYIKGHQTTMDFTAKIAISEDPDDYDKLYSGWSGTHDYDPRWDYHSQLRPHLQSHPLVQQAQTRLDSHGAQGRVFAADLSQNNAVGTYIAGTGSDEPVMLIDPQMHELYTDSPEEASRQIGRTVDHEYHHALQDSEGSDFNEDEAETHFGAKEMQNPEQMGFDMDVPEIQKTPKLAKYGAFMGGHLQSIAKISQYVDEILKAALEDVHSHDGSGHHFRATVLQLGISGVGPKVCSFAWLLLQPMTSQLATIDTHMMDVLGHNFEKDMNNRDYFKFERELKAGRDASGYSDMPLGMFQWGMWDHKRTGPGSHQDHSAMKVLNPTPHSSIDWEDKAQNLKGENWLNRAPEWWQMTAPAREATASAWDENQAQNTAQNRYPFVQGQGTSMPGTVAHAASVSTLVPYFIHPVTGARLQGSPGTTLMQHARSVLGGEPEDIWSQLPDEAVGKV